MHNLPGKEALSFSHCPGGGSGHWAVSPFLVALHTLLGPFCGLTACFLTTAVFPSSRLTNSMFLRQSRLFAPSNLFLYSLFWQREPSAVTLARILRISLGASLCWPSCHSVILSTSHFDFWTIACSPAPWLKFWSSLLPFICCFLHQHFSYPVITSFQSILYATVTGSSISANFIILFSWIKVIWLFPMCKIQKSNCYPWCLKSFRIYFQFSCCFLMLASFFFPSWIYFYNFHHLTNSYLSRSNLGAIPYRKLYMTLKLRKVSGRRGVCLGVYSPATFSA